MKKLAVIRKDIGRGCPFGLPIPLACNNAGNSVENMEALEDLPESKEEKVKAANRRVYRHHKTDTRCPYADKIVEKLHTVHCDFREGGEGFRDFPIRPSPYYPRMFGGLGQRGLYSHPVDYYWDNPEARQFFSGIFSIYASTGEIHINKDSRNPDPSLLALTSNIAIKDK